MDNAATTALNKEVLDAMMPYLTDIYGNPSSLHTFGHDYTKRIQWKESHSDNLQTQLPSYRNNVHW